MNTCSSIIKSKLTSIPEQCSKCGHVIFAVPDRANCTASEQNTDLIYVPGVKCIYKQLRELEEILLEVTPNFIIEEMENE